METNDGFTTMLTLIRAAKKECVKQQQYHFASKLRDLEREVEREKIKEDYAQIEFLEKQLPEEMLTALNNVRLQTQQKIDIENKAFDQYIIDNKGKKIIGYNPENYWPIFG